MPRIPRMKRISCPTKRAIAAIKPIRISLPKINAEQKRIGQMLLENTGMSFLDSGSAYGRHWESNQKVGLAGLLKQPAVAIHGEANGSFYVTKSLIHTLPSLIQITKDSETLQKQFDAFSKDKDESDLELMETFSKQKMTPDTDLSGAMTINTYNDPDTYDLSQDIQFTLFPMKAKYFVALQIHNGCDARGGYTTPKFFELPDDWRDFIQGLETTAMPMDETSDTVSGGDIIYTARKDGWKFKNGKVVTKKGKEVVFD